MVSKNIQAFYMISPVALVFQAAKDGFAENGRMWNLDFGRLFCLFSEGERREGQKEHNRSEDILLSVVFLRHEQH